MSAVRGWRADANPDKVILAVGKCLGDDETTFEEWTELSLLTGTRDEVQSHPRLLRSKSWGDDDHQEHVYRITPKILGETESPVGRAPRRRSDLGERFPNLQVVSDFLQVPTWLAEHEPALFAEVCEPTGPGDATMPDGTVLDAAEQAAARLGVEEMRRQIDRIRRDHSADPEAAIGQCKELVESVCKTILGMTGAGPDTKEDVPALVKQTMVHLGMDAAKLPEGDDPAEVRAARRLMGGVSSVLNGAAELRNARGTGHGRSGVPLVDAALARLAVGLVLPAVVYMVEVYERTTESGQAPKLIVDRGLSSPAVAPVGSVSPSDRLAEALVGDVVDHPAFGRGTVLETSRNAPGGQQATVDFGPSGTKRLAVRYAPLRLVSR